MTWSEIKAYLLAVEPAAFQGQGLVNTDNELKRYAQFTNNEIISNPYNFVDQIEDYTLTLNSTGEYDLSSLIPDYMIMNQIHGEVTPGGVLSYKQLTEANKYLEGGVLFSLKGKTLIVSGLESGTVKVQYFSKWLVKNDTGVRITNFSDDTDVTTLNNPHVLIEGMIRFIKRKLKEPIPQMTARLFDGRIAPIDTFQYLLEQSILNDGNVRGIPLDIRN